MDAVRTECKEFRTSARRSWREVRHAVHRTSWHHIILALAGVAMAIFGAGGQIIFLNRWLAATSGTQVGGPYSVLLTSGLASLLLYVLVAIYWGVRYRPNLGCLWSPAVWSHCATAGVLFAANGFLVVFATAKGVDEILQAILISSQIVWTLMFAVVFKINRGKNYCHVLVVSAVLLSVVGILLGTLATETGSGASSSPHPPDQGAWTVLFALGIVPGALTNVVAARFLQMCAYDDDQDINDDEDDEDNNNNDDENENDDGTAAAPNRKGRSDLTNDSNRANEDDETRRQQQAPLIDKRENICPPCPCPDRSGGKNKNGGYDTSGSDEEDTAANTEEQEGSNSSNPLFLAGGIPKADIGSAKVIFLVVGTLFQVIVTVVLMPLNWAPWFGMASNSTEGIDRLDAGLNCIFDNLENDGGMCSSSALYFALFAACFALTNSGNLIISQFSAPLTSMVNQIASPLTAVLIEIFPALSPNPVNANVTEAVFAVIMIIGGACLFSFWEELTTERQYQDERHRHHHHHHHRHHHHDAGEDAATLSAADTGGVMITPNGTTIVGAGVGGGDVGVPTELLPTPSPSNLSSSSKSAGSPTSTSATYTSTSATSTSATSRSVTTSTSTASPTAVATTRQALET